MLPPYFVMSDEFQAVSVPRLAPPLAPPPWRGHIPRMGIAITLNGEPRRVSAANIAELLREIGLDTRKVAVERNEEIVPRSAYAAATLAAGDVLEIVHFIGGG